MPGDPVLLDEVRGWLRKAASDLRTAELARAASPPLQDQAVFHRQQAVEKALKGFRAGLSGRALLDGRGPARFVGPRRFWLGPE